MILAISGKCHPYHSYERRIANHQPPLHHTRERAGTHLDAHRVDVDLLVEVIEESDGLNDHGVDLVGGELELVAASTNSSVRAQPAVEKGTKDEPGEGVGETELHGADVLGVDVVEEGGELGSDSTVEVVDGRVGDDREGELLGDGTSCTSIVSIALARGKGGGGDEPSLVSETASFSFLNFLFSLISVRRNSLRDLETLPSPIEVMSSTAAAVEVKRWIAWSLTLRRREKSQCV